MIGVVVNPHAARAGRDRWLVHRLREIVGDRGEVVETRSPRDLAIAVEHFASLGCDLVGTCGGDGTNLSTLSQVVRVFGDRLPRFAILRGGTVNTIAKNLGVRGTPEEILARLVARLDGPTPPRTVRRNLVEVNGMHGFLFAAAMGARFLETYYALPRQGVLPASLLAARTTASCLARGPLARRLFALTPCTVTVDGQRLPLEAASLLVGSTVPDVGVGMKVAWRAGAVLDRFHLVASSLSAAAMAVQLPSVLGGRAMVGPGHFDLLASRVDVRFATRQPFTLDGDLFHARDVALRCGPRLDLVV